MFDVFDGCLLVVWILDVGGDKLLLYWLIFYEENFYLGLCGICLIL